MPFTTADLVRAITQNDTMTLENYWREQPERVNVFGADSPEPFDKTSPLLFALRKNKMDVVRCGLKVPGRNLNFIDSENETLLSVAIEKGNLNLVIELDNLNVNLDIPNHSLLFYVAEKKQHKILFYFLNKGIVDGLNSVNEEGKTIFSLFADEQQWYPLSRVLSINGADVNAGGHGKKILSLAAIHGRIDVMTAILKNNKIDINTVFGNNLTAFSVALKKRDIPMLKLLLKQPFLDISGFSPQYLFNELMDITVQPGLPAKDALYFLKQVQEPNSVLHNHFWKPSLSWFSLAPSEKHGVLYKVNKMIEKIETHICPSKNSDLSNYP